MLMPDMTIKGFQLTIMVVLSLLFMNIHGRIQVHSVKVWKGKDRAVEGTTDVRAEGVQGSWIGDSQDAGQRS